MDSLNGNWVDLVILIIFAYYVSEAWRVGLWIILADFFAFLLSLLIALRGYAFVSGFLRTNFALSHSLSNALGYLVVAGVSESILSYLFGFVVSKVPEKFWHKSWSKALAILPALGEGMILVAFILTLIMGLPVTPRVKEDISSSKIGGAIIAKTTGLEATLNEIFGGVIEDSLTYLTIKPGSKESIPIQAKAEQLTVDATSESAMFKLVNEERKKQGAGELTWRPELVPVARAHATDMWKRGYFSHYSPEGKDVGDRLGGAHITYTIAGENLALAPTLSTAHNGLMNSPGHRANILEARFKRMGIGVIDNGFYGKMFVQIFSD